MLRMFLQIVFGAVLLTAIAALGLTMAMDASSSDTSLVVVVGMFALVALVLTRRRTARDGLRRYAPQPDLVVPAAAPLEAQLDPEVVKWTNWLSEDRPVMFYGSDIFDPFNNDPITSEGPVPRTR